MNFGTLKEFPGNFNEKDFLKSKIGEQLWVKNRPTTSASHPSWPCQPMHRHGGTTDWGSPAGDGGSGRRGEQEGSKGHVSDKPRGGGAHCGGLSTATAEMR
jgi:hypothetical protein